MPLATAPHGARLFYEVAGAGPSVLLLHGGLWDRRLWDDQWDALTARFFTDAAIERGDVGAALDLELVRWCPLRNGHDEHHRRIAHENLDAMRIESDLIDVHEERAIDRLGDIRVPTMVLGGDSDVPDMLRIAARLAADIPGARHAIIPEADHVPNIRNPVDFNRKVIGFLGEAA